MSNKPPWADQVVETTREEYYALAACGVEVGYDWSRLDGSSWDDTPRWLDRLAAPESGRILYFYYIRKEGTDEQQ